MEKLLLALVNIGAQLLFGLAAVWVGYRFGNHYNVYVHFERRLNYSFVFRITHF